jgi:hypothetical protein
MAPARFNERPLLAIGSAYATRKRDLETEVLNLTKIFAFLNRESRDLYRPELKTTRERDAYASSADAHSIAATPTQPRSATHRARPAATRIGHARNPDTSVDTLVSRSTFSRLTFGRSDSVGTPDERSYSGKYAECKAGTLLRTKINWHYVWTVRGNFLPRRRPIALLIREKI